MEEQLEQHVQDDTEDNVLETVEHPLRQAPSWRHCRSLLVGSNQTPCDRLPTGRHTRSWIESGDLIYGNQVSQFVKSD